MWQLEAGASMKDAFTRSANGWSRFIAWTKLGIALLFLPIMAFLFIVSPETRLFTAIAIAFLIFFLVRIVRAVTASSTSHSQSELQGRIDNALQESNYDTTTLWRVHLGIVCGQLLGVVVAWLIWPSPRFLAFVACGASFSIVGFALGVWWDSHQPGGWVQATTLVRRFYTVGALAATLVGITLVLMLRFMRPE